MEADAEAYLELRVYTDGSPYLPNETSTMGSVDWLKTNPLRETTLWGKNVKSANTVWTLSECVIAP